MPQDQHKIEVRPQLFSALVQSIVDRFEPPLPRRIVDHDILGNPIYADEVICPGG